MKKIISIIISIIMMLSTVNVMLAEESILMLSSSSAETKRGQSFEISLDISNPISITGIQCAINYDLKRFTAKESTLGEAFNNAVVSTCDITRAGLVKIAVVYAEATEVSGNLCKVTLKTDYTAYSGTPEISVADILVTYGDGSTEVFNGNSVTINVNAPAQQTQVPEVNPSPSQQPSDDTEDVTQTEIPSETLKPTSTPEPAKTEEPGSQAGSSIGSGGSGGGSGSSVSKPSANQTEKPDTTKAPSEEPSKEPSESVSTASPDHVFEDTIDHWGKEDISALYKKGIVNGVSDTIFEPDRSITRAEFTKIIVMAAGLEQIQTSSFTDVESDAWYNPYVGAAEKHGIVMGADGFFRPDDSISRQEMAVIVYRAFGDKLSSGSAPLFEDAEFIAEWAVDAVNVLAGAGIIKGLDDNKFGPDNIATRAQSAAIVNRILSY